MVIPYIRQGDEIVFGVQQGVSIPEIVCNCPRCGLVLSINLNPTEPGMKCSCGYRGDF